MTQYNIKASAEWARDLLARLSAVKEAQLILKQRGAHESEGPTVLVYLHVQLETELSRVQFLLETISNETETTT